MAANGKKHFQIILRPFQVSFSEFKKKVAPGGAAREPGQAPQAGAAK
jgi:hypothetical protein